MLPGMGSIMAGITVRSYLWAVSANNGSGTSLTINKPTGTVDGDIMVAVMSGGNAGAWTGDTGWTEILDQGATPNIRAAYKVASGEGASYTFSHPAGGGNYGFLATFRGLQYDTVSASASTQTGDGTLAVTGITAAGGVLIAAYAITNAFSGLSSSTPGGMISLASSGTGLDGGIFGYWQEVAAGATGTRSSSLGTDMGQGAGILIALKP